MLRRLDTDNQIKPRHRHRDSGAPMPAYPRTLKFHMNKLLEEKLQLIEEPDRDYANKLSALIDEKLGLLDEIRKEILAYEAFWLSRIEYAFKPIPEG